jgi:glycosyltransferase involved in cell wall biosynthesis
MKVAILIPCYNEAITIAKVVDDFKHVMPEADVYVYDNNSTDGTGDIAREHGAIVRRELRQGKGFVVRSMFRQVDADIYVMVDGDDTYPAEAAPALITPILAGDADMVIGDRLSNGAYAQENKRAFHGLGNSMVRGIINGLYHANIRDIMTGYRAFSRIFVKTYPVLAKGFEIETDLSVHALDKDFIVSEVPIDYRDRPQGSFSKLNTFSDGMKVLVTILNLFKDYKPLAFFSWCSLLFFAFGLIIGVPVVLEYARTGLVPRFPSAILAMGLVLVSLLLFICGLILDTTVKGVRKNYELMVNEVYDRDRARGRDCCDRSGKQAGSGTQSQPDGPGSQ